MTRPVRQLMTTALLLALLTPSMARGASAPAGSPAERSNSFTYEVSYPRIPKSAMRFELWVPVPPSNSHQEISDLVFLAPGGGTSGFDKAHGNRVFHGESGRRGGVAYNFKMHFVVKRQAVMSIDPERPPAVPPDAPANLSDYLEGTSRVPVDGEIRSLAGKATKGRKKIHGKARAIYDWVVKNIELSQEGEGWGEGDLKYVISTRKGNSMDVAAAFVGLARAAQIPARHVVGFKLPEDRDKGFLTRYHAWAEYWLPGFGWIPVDPAEAIETPSRADMYFGTLDENRVQMSTGRDVRLVPAQSGEPLNFLLYPYAEADGKPLHGSGYRFSFDAPPAPEPVASGGSAL